MDQTQEGLMLFAMWLLALTRFAGFFVQAPIFGSHHFDKKILVALAATMAFVAFPELKLPKDFSFDLIPYFLMVITQGVVGLVIGYVSFMIMAAAQFGGELLDVQMGLSVAASFDPATGSTVNMMRRLKFYLCMILYLLMDGHHFLIQAMFKSFDIIPLTGVDISGKVITHLVLITGQIFVLGIQIAAPALAALFLTQVALGLLARVAPQMNVFMLSFPLNIAIGLTLVSSSMYILMLMYRNLFAMNNADVMSAINSMIPK